MQKLKHVVEALEDWIAGLFIVGGLFLILLGVVMRYVFNSPLSFVEEYAGYMVVWGTMIGAVVALRDNHHIRIDMFYRLLPERVKKAVDIFANVVGLIFALFLVVYGVKGIFLDEFSAYQMGIVSIGEGVELWKVYMVMPLMGVWMLFRFIVRLVRVSKGLPESDYEHKGVEQV
ncbi:TRAP transporter small permease [Anoxybacillus sp. TBDG-1]